jgi:starch-binding outer membrane protein, SusD/RagB family
MMNRGIRWASATGVALGALLFSACDVRETLLSPQQPGTILPEDLANAGAAGAEAIRVGALGRLQQITPGGGNGNQSSAAMLADALTDVWKSGDTFSQHNETDQRTVQTNNSVLSTAYTTITQSRGFYRDAIDALKQYIPETPAKQGEMFFAMGYSETAMAEYFCSGIPLSETVNGVWTYAAPLTTQEVFARAITHLDTALTLSAGTDAFSTSIRHAAAVAKGRTLVNMGRWTDAVAAVAAVPTAFSYNVTFSQPTNSNNVWNLAGQVSSRARFVVGDSFDTQGIIPNALPFSSAKDPRVPTTGSPTNTTTKSIDGVTPLVAQQIWTDRAHPIPVVSGLDARLIEAEAKLQANDIAGMMTILNQLRSTPPSLGPLTPAAMAALATPATKDAATTLFFREKAFWQFGRGTRLGDLRRLVRQYNRPADQVFPTGRFHKSGGAPYGTDVNLPVTDNERTNPTFTGCLNRSA